jgi:galactokinase/mevalonate kinase-like predicted kinase
MAVNLWSEVTVSRADKFIITAEGEGAEEMPKDETNLLVLGCQKAFEAANKEMPILQYHVVSKIPYARGLGSSSAAIVAGIIAGLVLAGHRLPCWGSEALLQIAAGIEVCALWLCVGCVVLSLSSNTHVVINSIFLCYHKSSHRAYLYFVFPFGFIPHTLI